MQRIYSRNVLYLEVFDNRNRSSHQRCSVTKCFFRNFATFTVKHLCQRLFLITCRSEVCNFIIKETLAQVFFFNFTKFLRTTLGDCFCRNITRAVIFLFSSASTNKLILTMLKLRKLVKSLLK